MLKVHVTDGRTLSFDLNDEGQRGEWDRLAASSAFQSTIRGVALLHNHTLHVVTLPKGFRSLRFSAELLKQRAGGKEQVLGEVVVCQADMIRTSLTVFYKPTSRVARVDTVRSGRQRFNGLQPRSVT